MRLEDALPALRAGRRARRESWPLGDHVTVEFVGGKRLGHFTMKSGASEHTWPGSQLESRDMLEDDWELLFSPEYEAHIPGNYREAFDVVFSLMSHEVFDAYSDVKKSRSYGQAGVEGMKADCDWRKMGKDCLDCYMKAAYAKSPSDVKIALARACIASLKALSYYVAEVYVEQVMRG